MKQLFFAACMVSLLSSCRKNWICTCEVLRTEESTAHTQKKYASSTNLKIIKRSSRSTARANCMSSVTTSSVESYFGSTPATIVTTLDQSCYLE